MKKKLTAAVLSVVMLLMSGSVFAAEQKQRKNQNTAVNTVHLNKWQNMLPKDI